MALALKLAVSTGPAGRVVVLLRYTSMALLIPSYTTHARYTVFDTKGCTGRVSKRQLANQSSLSRARTTQPLSYALLRQTRHPLFRKGERILPLGPTLGDTQALYSMCPGMSMGTPVHAPRLLGIRLQKSAHGT